MKAERLRDDDALWGLTRIEYAFRERQRMRAAERMRRSRYLMKLSPAPRDEKGHFIGRPADSDIWPLTSQEGRELGIVAISSKAMNRYRMHNPHFEGADEIPVSLPYVTFLYGPREA